MVEPAPVANELERAGRINAIFESYVDAMHQVRGAEANGAELETRLLALEAFVETALLMLARDCGDADAFVEELGQRVASVREVFGEG
jgi:hypothetical protein